MAGGRGRGRGGNNSRPDWEESGDAKRQKYDGSENVEQRLRFLIVRIGDQTTSASSLENKLESLSKALEDDIPKHERIILETLLQCVMELPVKTPVYGTLAGLLNAKNPQFGLRLVERTAQHLQYSLDHFEITHTKLLVRFLCELNNSHVIQSASLWTVLDQFLAPLEDNERCPQAYRDYIAYLILACMPYGAKELAISDEDRLRRDLRVVQQYVGSRRLPEVSVNAVFHNQQASEDWLEQLSSRVRLMVDDRYATAATLAPSAAFQSHFNSSTRHEFPPIAVPPYAPSFSFDPPAAFRLFPSAEADLDIKPIDRFVVEEWVVDLLGAFSQSPKDCGKFLLTLPVKFPYTMVLIEAVFGQLLKLPKPPVKNVYYAVMTLELCRSAPKEVAPVLAKGIDALFERLDVMDVECVDRFSEWFAHHLSNFDYKWDWTQWEYVLDLPEVSSKRMFLKAVIERSMRLSYYERIEKTVPDLFLSFMPERPEPYMKYANAPSRASDPDDVTDKLQWEVACTVYKELLEKMRPRPAPATDSRQDARPQRASAEELLRTLQEAELQPLVALDVLVHAILNVGSKSFSHMLNIVEKYLMPLQSLATTNEAKQNVGKAVMSFWRRSPQNVIITMDKLMTYRVLDNTAIINWLFSDSMTPLFVQSWVWEILRNAINKTIARTDTVRADLKAAETELARLKADNKKEVLAEKERKARQIRETLEGQMRDQKAMFIIVFQRFCMVLTDRLVTLDAKRMQPEQDYWFFRTSGHMREVGRKYAPEIRSFTSTLENLLFSSEDSRITEIFNQFKTPELS